MKTLTKIVALVILISLNVSITHSQVWVAKTSGVATQLLDVCSIDNQNAVTVGTYGVILKTSDGGENWVLKNSNTAINLTSVTFPDVNTGFAVGQDGVIIKSTDGGNTWSTLTAPVLVQWEDVFFVNANIGYVVGLGGVMIKTTDGGTTWTELTTNYGGYDLYTIYFIDANTGWIAGNAQNSILKTTDGGSTWTAYASGVGGAVYSLYFSNASNGILTGSTGIEKSTNGGTSFSNVLSSSFYGYGVWFPSSLNGWACGKNGKLAKTIDGGSTWTIQPMSTYNFYGIHFSNSSTGYAVGSAGQIYRYYTQMPVTVHVTDNFSNPINGATVTFNGLTQTTNISGNTTFSNIIPGNYPITVSAVGFTTYTSNITEPGNDPINVQLQPVSTGYSVNFFVKDNANLPVFNALVTFKSLTWNTDVNGLVTFNNVPAGNNQSYSVSKTGYTTTSGSCNVNQNLTINLTLADAVANTFDITFHVIDNLGNDLQGASVTFNGSTQITDVSGLTLFSGVSSGLKSYAINKSGYDPTYSSVNVIANQTETAALFPTSTGYTISFYVYDGSSNPINAATVTFDGVTQNTNASGETIFTNVPAGNIHYTVTKAGYIPVDDYVNEPGNDPVSVYMTAVGGGTDINFNVYDDVSNPISGASVTFNGVAQSTNASGTTLFANVPAGDINYEVVKSGYITVSGSVTEPGNDPVNVTMTSVGSGLTINFYVYDLSTNYIDGAMVTFNGVTQYSDATGTATFTNVPYGNLNYEVSKAGYITQSGNVNEPGNDPIIISLAPDASGLEINFWVYDNQTNAIDGASVTFDGVSQTTDASGNTVFHNVATGNLYYEVSMAGYNTYGNYVDEPGNDPIVVTLQSSSSNYNVMFDVNDELGNPVENATVTFNLTDQQTDAVGSTQYTSIPESDNYWYNVTKAGYFLSTGNINVHSDITESVVLMHDYSGIHEINAVQQVTTFPNPITDEVEITLNEKITGIKILNSTGQELMSVLVGDLKTKVDMKHFPKGLYIIQIQTMKNNSTKKIIKE